MSDIHVHLGLVAPSDDTGNELFLGSLRSIVNPEPGDAFDVHNHAAWASNSDDFIQKRCPIADLEVSKKEHQKERRINTPAMRNRVWMTSK